MEDLLRTHPLIKDCRVVDVPDSRSGQLPRALVVRRDKNLTEQDVKDFVKSKRGNGLKCSRIFPDNNQSCLVHLAEYKQLRGGVEFVEELLDAMCA